MANSKISNLEWCWICNSRMRSLVSPLMLAFYSKCLLLLHFPFLFMNKISMRLFFLLWNSFKFFNQTFIIHFNMLKMIEIECSQALSCQVGTANYCTPWFVALPLGFCDLNDYTLCCHWALNLDNYIYIHCDGECFHLHHGFFIDLCNLYHRNHFFMIISILVIHISIFLSFPIESV
jgi:hypothetical protein